MGKLTKQEVFESIELIDNGDYENSLVEFFEDIDELILNVTQEEKENIIKFITQQITSWNNFSYENLEYDNLLYKNIVIYYDGQIDYEPYYKLMQNEITRLRNENKRLSWYVS